MAYANFLPGMSTTTSVPWAAYKYEDDESKYIGGYQRYARRRMPFWSDASTSSTASVSSPIDNSLSFSDNSTDSVSFNPSSYLSSGLYGSTEEGKIAEGYSEAARDRVSNAFYGGLTSTAVPAALGYAKTYGLGTMLGAPSKMVGDMAFNSAISGLPTGLTSTVANTMATSLGIDNSSTLGNAAKQVVGWGSSLLGTPISILGKLVAPFVGGMVGDITDSRSMEVMRDVGEDKYGWSKFNNALNDAIDTANLSTEGYSQGIKDAEAAIAEASKTLADPDKDAVAKYKAVNDMSMAETVRGYMQDAIDSNPAYTGLSMMQSLSEDASRNSKKFKPSVTAELESTLSADELAALGINVNPESAIPGGLAWSGNPNSINNPNPLHDALAGAGISTEGLSTTPGYAESVRSFNNDMALAGMTGSFKDQMRSLAIDKAIRANTISTQDGSDVGGDTSNGGLGPSANSLGATLGAISRGDWGGNVGGVTSGGDTSSSDTSSAADTASTVDGRTSGSIGNIGNPGGMYGGGSSTGGSGAAAGGRVICSELVRQGLMDKNILAIEAEHTFKTYKSATIRGYHLWAVPFVRLMQRSPKLSKWTAIVAHWRTDEIMHILNKQTPGSWKGKLIRAIFEPVCYLLGLCIKYDNVDSKWDRWDSKRRVGEDI